MVQRQTGEADNPTVVDEGAGTEVGAETLVEITVAMDGGTLEAGDSVRLVFGVDAADQTVHCIDLWVEYTKTQ